MQPTAPSTSQNASAYPAFQADNEDSGNGTETDTVSSIGEGMYDLPYGSPDEQAQELFWNYQHHKAKWRSYMQKPTRRARRVIRRKGKTK